MVYLRPADAQDEDLILVWANDPLTRASSFNTNKISKDEHAKWFAGVLTRTDVELYVMMDGDVPVGQIRIAIEGDTAEVSNSMAPEARGKGYGKKSFALLEEKVRKIHPEIAAIIARVKPENLASSKSLLDNGYVQTDSNKDFITFRRSLR